MKIRLGTRSSKLALIQAHMVEATLLEKAPQVSAVEIIQIKTTGDNILKPLAHIGGKALFLKELEEELLENKIDIAVHSLKDVPAIIPEGLTIAGFLPREDPRDAFISSVSNDINSLPLNAVVGSCSPRRSFQLLGLRPDLRIVPIRGNVDSRIKKVMNKEVEATVLAAAGLIRLSASRDSYKILSYEEMVPAVGQGVICIECKEDKPTLISVLEEITDAKTKKLVLAERGFLETVQGSCSTPLGAYASYVSGSTIKLVCFLAKEDGSKFAKTSFVGEESNSYNIGVEAANSTLSQLG